jgi:hypothetical protein
VAVLGIARPLLGPGGLDLGRGGVFGTLPAIDVTLSDRMHLEPAPPQLGGGLIAAGQGGELHGPLKAQVQLFSLDWPQRLGVIGSQVLAGVVAFGVLLILWLIVRSLDRGEPFRSRNITLLVVMAGLVGIGGEAAVMLSLWGRMAVLSQPALEPYVVTDGTLNFLPVVAMAGILLTAEIFRRGRTLREDVEGLV